MMRLRSLLVALFLYTLLLFASFYPESFKPADTIAYIGDALESVYIVAWNVHQFFRSPFELFEANFLYPNPRALAFADHRLLPSLLVAPVIWISRNPVLAYHVALALGSLLAAFAARSLARQLGANDLGAWTAGALYAFHTYQIHEAPRLHIIFHGFLPLALGQLLLLLSTGKRKHALGTGAFMLLQGLSANYHLLYGSLLLGLTLVAFLIARPGPTLRRLPSLFLVAFLAGMLYFPFAWPYLENSTAHDYHRELPRGHRPPALCDHSPDEFRVRSHGRRVSPPAERAALRRVCFARSGIARPRARESTSKRSIVRAVAGQALGAGGGRFFFSSFRRWPWEEISKPGG